MAVAVETRPVGPAELTALADLFATERTTRHCWCTAFCTTRREFTAGWFTGGNRRRFTALADERTEPMGVLACRAEEPVGWCACGPRSRYLTTAVAQDLLRHRVAAEDDRVWLLPCLFIRAGHRGQGITGILVRAAVDLARRAGAEALESWPSASSSDRGADAFLGREHLFARHGFAVVATPAPGRLIMRLGLTAD